VHEDDGVLWKEADAASAHNFDFPRKGRALDFGSFYIYKRALNSDLFAGDRSATTAYVASSRGPGDLASGREDMSETEPTRRLPPRDVRHYALGFVKPVPGSFKIFGSGTLVRVGRLSGIVTAAHVWDAIKNLDEIGFFQFPTRPSEIQSTKEQIGHLEVEEINNGMQDALGADIAFIKLSRSKASDLERLSSFLNLEKGRAAAFEPVPAHVSITEGIAGVVAEKGTRLTKNGPNTVARVEAILNHGLGVPIQPGRQGLDRLEFTPMPDENYQLPKSYGGTSGGGLFRAYTSGDEVFGFHLRGVAFYETGGDVANNRLICHGPQSIYDALLNAVKTRWASEI
jgi:hypothetical protein